MAYLLFYRFQFLWRLTPFYKYFLKFAMQNSGGTYKPP